MTTIELAVVVVLLLGVLWVVIRAHRKHTDALDLLHHKLDGIGAAVKNAATKVENK